jgi:hypothetical protein
MRTANRLALILFVSVACVGCDQTTKSVAQSYSWFLIFVAADVLARAAENNMPTVNLPSGAVHYAESGQGVPLVLLHAKLRGSLSLGASPAAQG